MILLERPADGIARITLNRPEKRNALSTALRNEVSDSLEALAADESVKVVVVTGAGDVFCAGFDLKEFEVDDAEFQQKLWASSDRFHRVFLGFPLPLIAAVNGPALAGGFDVAIMCDIRIASESARFAHPEQRFSDVVYGPLHDHVGGAVARDLAFTGRSIDAQEALRLHLVSKVVPDGEVVAVAEAMAHEVTQAPRDILMRTKRKAIARSGYDPTAATLQI